MPFIIHDYCQLKGKKGKGLDTPSNIASVEMAISGPKTLQKVLGGTKGVAGGIVKGNRGREKLCRAASVLCVSSSEHQAKTRIAS